MPEKRTPYYNTVMLYLSNKTIEFWAKGLKVQTKIFKLLYLYKCLSSLII